MGKHIVIYAPNPPSAISSKSWNGKSAPWRGLEGQVLHVTCQYPSISRFFLARPDQDKGKPEIDRK